MAHLREIGSVVVLALAVPSVLGAARTDSAVAARADACISSTALGTWSTARLAAQTLAPGGPEEQLGALVHEVEVGVGGIVLFGDTAPANLAVRIRELEGRSLGRIAPLVMTDEEGGAVQRMANLVGQVPAPRTMGETMTPAQIEALATGLGRRLRAAGVTVDLAPVLDVDGGEGPNARDPDGTRSFSPSVATASLDGVAFASGLQRGGVIAVAKHFPGLGGASGNTDDGPASTIPWPELSRSGLRPFVAAVAAHVDAVMVANATVPGFSNGPASLSSRVVGSLLRHRLGFRGLVMTDALSAKAIEDIGYTVPSAAVAALRAGQDLVLYQAPTARPDAVTNATLRAIVRAVQSGELERSRLIDAASHVLSVKHLLCVAPA